MKFAVNICIHKAILKTSRDCCLVASLEWGRGNSSCLWLFKGLGVLQRLPKLFTRWITLQSIWDFILSSPQTDWDLEREGFTLLPTRNSTGSMAKSAGEMS